MTIRKNTSRAMKVIADAYDIRCYSLSNNFSGEPLAEKPVMWTDTKNDGRFEHGSRPLVEVSQRDFLYRELNSRHAKLSGPLIDPSGDRYYLHVHSNLWYEFRA